jgi:hypothetical protein
MSFDRIFGLLTLRLTQPISELGWELVGGTAGGSRSDWDCRVC